MTEARVIQYENYNLPRNEEGSVLWKTLAEDEAQFIHVVDSIVTQLNSNGLVISRKSLEEAGHRGLTYAINAFYPNKIWGIREKMGSSNYPREKWKTDGDFLAYAEKLVESGSDLSRKNLTDLGEGQFIRASKKIPGALPGIRQRLGIETKRKPRGYWESIENIELETKKFIDLGYKLTYEELNKSYALQTAIKLNYPGGLSGIRVKLGFNATLAKAKGYWKNLQNIENEAKKVFEIDGSLTPTTLKRHGLGALPTVVRNYYPGGMQALREKIGAHDNKSQADEMLRKLMEGVSNAQF